MKNRRAFWERSFQKYRSSGLTQEEFCRREKLNVGTFRTWLYRLRKEGTSLVRVEVKPSISKVEATFPNGIVVRFDEAAPEFIAAILKAC